MAHHHLTLEIPLPLFEQLARRTLRRLHIHRKLAIGKLRTREETAPSTSLSNHQLLSALACQTTRLVQMRPASALRILESMLQRIVKS